MATATTIGAKRRKPLKTTRIAPSINMECNHEDELDTCCTNENKMNEEAPELSSAASHPIPVPIISTTTVLTSGPDNSYKCPLCSEMLLTQKQFTAHIRGHNDVKPHPDPTDPSGQAKVYYCCLCGKMLSSFSSLDRHMLVHSGERPFSCQLCGQTFTTNGNMHRHKRTHSAKELMELKEALAQAEREKALANPGSKRSSRKRKNHDKDDKVAKVNNTNNNNNNGAPKNTVKPFPIPNATLPTVPYPPEMALREAGRLPVLPTTPLPPDPALASLPKAAPPPPGLPAGPLDVERVLERAKEAAELLVAASKEDTSQDSSSVDDKDPQIKDMKLKGEFPCRLCPAVYPNLRALKGHNKEHLSRPPYRCNVGKCTFWSNDKSRIIQHMRLHTGEKPYECKLCNYGFTTKANCERHLKNKHGKSGRDDIRNSLIIHENAEENQQQLGNRIKFNRGEMEQNEGGAENKRFRCKVCKVMFASSMAVVGHGLREHPAYSTDVDHIFEEVSNVSTEMAVNTEIGDLGGPSMVPRAPTLSDAMFADAPLDLSQKKSDGLVATPNELLLHHLATAPSFLSPMLFGPKAFPLNPLLSLFPGLGGSSLLRKPLPPMGAQHLSANGEATASAANGIVGCCSPLSNDAQEKAPEKEEIDVVDSINNEGFEATAFRNEERCNNGERPLLIDNGEENATQQSVLEENDNVNDEIVVDNNDDDRSSCEILAEVMEESDESDLGSITSLVNAANVADDGSQGDLLDSNMDEMEDEDCRNVRKSAYSSAPHVIACPYCSRKFPWRSSLKRHILTHTGDKPFKCEFCPLLFTTKSNCDRHQARKHKNGGHDNNDDDGEWSEEEENCRKESHVRKKRPGLMDTIAKLSSAQKSVQPVN